MALAHWRLVQQTTHGQSADDREIARLESKIAAAVRSHYRRGLKALSQKRLKTARNHFLTALRLNPAFQPAMKQIRVHFSSFPLAAFVSAPGDRPASIARDVFGDEEKDFLVAWFNDLPTQPTLIPGTLLILPKLKTAEVKPSREKQSPDCLAQARSLLAQDELEAALILAEQANSDKPDVQALIHSIYLKKAMGQIESGLLESARQSLALIPDGFTGKKAAVEKLNAARRQQQNTFDLAKAWTHFDRGQYQQSLSRVEAVLKNEPDRVAARDLANEAHYRLALNHLKRKRFLKAREELAEVDPSHGASGALMKTIHLRLMKLAQIHYRNGVKHYINENLKSAIAEWEKALACNPDHAKAKENIENARRLLRKIEAMP